MRSRLSFTALSGSPTTLKSCIRAEPTSTSTSTRYASIPYTEALIVLKSIVDVLTSAFSGSRVASKRHAHYKSISYYILLITHSAQQPKGASLYTRSAATYIGFIGSCIRKGRVLHLA